MIRIAKVISIVVLSIVVLSIVVLSAVVCFYLAGHFTGLWKAEHNLSVTIEKLQPLRGK